MHHHCRVFFTIFTDVGNIEALGQVKIDLDGRALPGFAQRTLKFNIYFGPVEYALSGVYLISHLGLFQSLAQGIGGFFPDFECAGIFVGSGGK